MARLSMAPYERCGDGIVAGREGICWSVVSNALRCQRSSEDASIPGVACRTLNRQHPCPSCASLGSHSKPPPPGTVPHRTATLPTPMPHIAMQLLLARRRCAGEGNRSRPTRALCCARCCCRQYRGSVVWLTFSCAIALASVGASQLPRFVCFPPHRERSNDSRPSLLPRDEADLTITSPMLLTSSNATASPIVRISRSKVADRLAATRSGAMSIVAADTSLIAKATNERDHFQQPSLLVQTMPC